MHFLVLNLHFNVSYEKSLKMPYFALYATNIYNYFQLSNKIQKKHPVYLRQDAFSESYLNLIIYGSTLFLIFANNCIDCRNQHNHF